MAGGGTHPLEKQLLKRTSELLHLILVTGTLNRAKVSHFPSSRSYLSFGNISQRSDCEHCSTQRISGNDMLCEKYERTARAVLKNSHSIKILTDSVWRFWLGARFNNMVSISMESRSDPAR